MQLAVLAALMLWPAAATAVVRKVFDPQKQRFVDPPSNETFTDDFGFLQTPGFPGNYPDNYNVTFNIMMHPDYFVHVTFLTFRTEAIYDTVTVYEGTQPLAASRITVLSGNRTGQVVESAGPNMLLVFSSDLANSDVGFFAEYTRVLKNTRYTPSHQCPRGPLTNLDDVMVYGIDTSPSWPDQYPNNADCSYWITVNAEFKIKLVIESFWTEECCDRLYIFEGVDKNGKLIANLSGTYENLPQKTIMTESSRLYMYFSTDLSNNGPGFSILYEEVD